MRFNFNNFLLLVNVLLVFLVGIDFFSPEKEVKINFQKVIAQRHRESKSKLSSEYVYNLVLITEKDDYINLVKPLKNISLINERQEIDLIKTGIFQRNKYVNYEINNQKFKAESSYLYSITFQMIYLVLFLSLILTPFVKNNSLKSYLPFFSILLNGFLVYVYFFY